VNGVLRGGRAITMETRDKRVAFRQQRIKDVGDNYQLSIAFIGFRLLTNCLSMLLWGWLYFGGAFMNERIWVVDVDDIACWLDQSDNPQRYGALSQGNFPITVEVSYQGSPCTNLFGYLQPNYGASYWPPGTYAPGWSATLHNDAVKVDSWSDYNSGVSSPSTGWHAKWILDKDIPGGVMCELNNPPAQSHRYLATSISVTSLLSANKNIVMSCDARGDKTIRLCLYGSEVSGDTNAILAYKDVYLSSEWGECNLATVYAVQSGGAGYILIYGDNNIGGDDVYGQAQVRNPMLTDTGRLCRYTPGTRGATVATGGGWMDVTFSGNNVDLTDSAFDWNDWIVSRGLYFTTTSSILNLGSAVISPTYNKYRFITIEAWVRRNSTANDAPTDCAIYGAQNSSGLVLNRYGQFNFVCANSASNLDGYEYPGIDSNRLIQYINFDQWYHIVQVIGNKHIVYVNGTKMHESANLSWNPSIGTSFKFLHGNADWLTQESTASTSKSRVMQDGCWNVQCVRVYKRALTENEVIACYNKERDLYVGALSDVSFDTNNVGDIAYA